LPFPQSARQELFPIPLWIAQFDELRPWLPGMIRTAESLIENDPSGENPFFEQSEATLQASNDPGWTKYFELLSRLMEQILAEGSFSPHYPVSRAFLRSWVVRMRSHRDFERTGGVLEVLHSHIPAVMTSVFYLQVPPHLVGRPEGGTVLRDPSSANTRPYRNVIHNIEAVPLRVAVFPGFIEHAPERPPPGPSFSVPRLLVSTDLRLDMG
jgi:hypothetical protein